MACTMRVASPNAKLGQPEVKLGIIAGYGGTQRLPRLVGRGRAMELLLTGDMIDAAEAHRIGLVNHVVDAGELLTFCRALMRRILANGPVARARSRCRPSMWDSNCGLEEGSAVRGDGFRCRRGHGRPQRRHARVSRKTPGEIQREDNKTDDRRKSGCARIEVRDHRRAVQQLYHGAAAGRRAGRHSAHRRRRRRGSS